jgi:hypothetical protein
MQCARAASGVSCSHRGTALRMMGGTLWRNERNTLVTS